MASTDEYRGKKHLLNMLLIANGALAAFIFFDSIIVLKESGGLNEFLSSATYLGYSFSAIIMLNNNPSAFSIGALLGSSVVLAVLAFLNTLYWAVAATNIDDHPIAAGFAAAFNLVFFGVDTAFILILYKSKQDIIETYSAYDYIPDVPTRAPATCAKCDRPLDDDDDDDTFSIHSYQSSAQAAAHPPLPTADI
ncbi:Aste57867_11049 [Aphanomyces stellatus]|uniref:Aste57867_11049 protein n=1 Tax=Aphanomyces stellatus TaxID=120398 RepID=A0A485KRW0_9STRA|nr:hypothetical protein As57867_011007 [Aphanomyces stellatus]VFT87917.1 Aste57867_11049 [Aphanomyces stellatus]